MTTEILKINGMSCEHCVHTVESALKKIRVSAKVDLAAGTAEVRYDDKKVSLDAVKKAIRDQGYEVP